MATRNPHASRMWCEVPFSGNLGDYCTGRQSSFILPSEVSLSVCSSPVLSPASVFWSSQSFILCFGPLPLDSQGCSPQGWARRGKGGFGMDTPGWLVVGSRCSWVSSPLRSIDHMAISSHEQGLHPTSHFLNHSTNTCVM